MANILIMGGSSFVSEGLAKYLIKCGYKIDILTRGKKSINYNGYEEHIVCDRKNPKLINDILKEKEYEYIFDINAYTRADVEILMNSINKSNLKKYIFCSSGAVYKVCNEESSENFQVGENENWGKYGLDKLEAENYIIKCKIPYVIFRPTYIYGRNNNLYRETYFFDRLKEGKDIPIPDSNNTTQFIYIDDLVKVFESCVRSKVKNEIYNVTNSEAVCWKELLSICSEASKKQLKIRKIKNCTVGTRRYFPFRDVTYKLNIDKLIDSGLYVPQVSLKDGIKETYKWYIKNDIKLYDSRMDKVDIV